MTKSSWQPASDRFTRDMRRAGFKVEMRWIGPFGFLPAVVVPQEQVDRVFGATKLPTDWIRLKGEKVCVNLDVRRLGAKVAASSSPAVGEA